jgi:hypothetical protein
MSFLYFSFCYRVQSGSEAHPAAYPICTKDSFPGVKKSEREVEHSLPSSAEVKNEWSYSSTIPYIFNGVVLNEAQGKFYFQFSVISLNTKHTENVQK